jgi:hypothetical protein
MHPIRRKIFIRLIGAAILQWCQGWRFSGDWTKIRLEPERQATLRSILTSKFSAKSVDKDIWYKVRLRDGLYTHFRRTMAWLKLRSVKGQGGESINDYVVAYATPGVDLGADFDRIEIYYWAGGQYQTAFVTFVLPSSSWPPGFPILYNNLIFRIVI